LWEHHAQGFGNTVAYSQQDTTLCMDLLCMEFSGVGKGDFREPMLELTQENGCVVTDFRCRAHRVYAGKAEIPGMPSAHGDCDTLEMTLDDPVSGASVILFYHVFSDCDIITRHMAVTAGEKPLVLHRTMSFQLDLPESGYSLTSFHGAWAREMQPANIRLVPGRYQSDSKTGTSSNQSNPFFMVETPGCTEAQGGCYGFNLVYSGNHCEIAEVNAFGRTRLLSGISPFCFQHSLAVGERFDTPEAVLTYSPAGRAGVSRNMHHFVREHIVRGVWQYRRRPVLVNSWEASYFDISEDKLVAQAKAAKALGAELYVVDDGWFGRRDDDTSSLGDWVENPKKIPSGLQGLAQKFAEIPMAMGLWIEPEMVNPDSDLYRKHPDWALAVSGTHPSMGRNQLVLDLSRDEVCDYIIARIVALIGSAGIAYVKWDMNRCLSDICSGEESHNSDFYHRYTLGYYKIAKAITCSFPKVLFEGCSGGGNRFDLGILCDMPQIWITDNTDAHCRVAIQTGAGYGYPQSVMGAHVSACPNHQTGRVTPLATRFAVAAFGLLGYELDVTKLGGEESVAIREQIAFYKEYGELLQFGNSRRLEFSNDNYTGWIVISHDQKEAIALLYQRCYLPNQPSPILRLPGLLPEQRYTVRELAPNGQQCVANGDLLAYAGMRLNRIAPAAGQGEGLLVLPDFGAALYHIQVSRE
ncbi:MAG: alpha-galactosidase, partial [Angelakisella sp.]